MLAFHGYREGATRVVVVGCLWSSIFRLLLYVSLGSTLCVGRLIYCFCLMVVVSLALEFELKVL